MSSPRCDTCAGRLGPHPFILWTDCADEDTRTIRGLQKQLELAQADAMRGWTRVKLLEARINKACKALARIE